MKGRVNIIVDAMGGDHAPHEIIRGCVDYLNKEKINEVKITLIGRESQIQSALLQHNYESDKIDVINANEIITFNEDPIKAIRMKKNSSIVKGMEILSEEDEMHAFISAGNTGALLSAGATIVGTLDGIQRPALGLLFPTMNNFSFLIDAGANMNVKPLNLKQFADMGAVYLENMLGLERPSIGLINVGEEKNKGSKITKEAYQLINESQLNFIGNIEGSQIIEGKADVLVCDGFTGNVILKYSEGFTNAFEKKIKENLDESFFYKLGSRFLKPLFDQIKKETDYTEYGGAPFLGLKKLVVKTHGKAKAFAIESTIRQSVNFVRQDIIDKISEIK